MYKIQIYFDLDFFNDDIFINVSMPYVPRIGDNLTLNDSQLRKVQKNMEKTINIDYIEYKNKIRADSFYTVGSVNYCFTTNSIMVFLKMDSDFFETEFGRK